jgi:hypothetical protein
LLTGDTARFWLAFVRAGIPAIERGRGDLVLQAVRSRWSDWRGRAVEPVVRESLWRLADDHLPPDSDVVSGYWTRTNDPEIDIVAADRSPIASRVTAVGSIKWHDQSPFDVRDLARLAHHRDRLPGTDAQTPLIAVSRTGTSLADLTTFTPDQLLTAWPL